MEMEVEERVTAATKRSTRSTVQSGGATDRRKKIGGADSSNAEVQRSERTANKRTTRSTAKPEDAAIKQKKNESSSIVGLRRSAKTALKVSKSTTADSSDEDFVEVKNNNTANGKNKSVRKVAQRKKPTTVDSSDSDEVLEMKTSTAKNVVKKPGRNMNAVERAKPTLLDSSDSDEDLEIENNNSANVTKRPMRKAVQLAKPALLDSSDSAEDVKIENNDTASVTKKPVRKVVQRSKPTTLDSSDSGDDVEINSSSTTTNSMKKSVRKTVQRAKPATADASSSAVRQKINGRNPRDKEPGKSVKTAVQLPKSKTIDPKKSKVNKQHHKSVKAATNDTTPSSFKAYDAVDRRKKMDAMDVMSLLTIGEAIGNSGRTISFDDPVNSSGESSEEDDWEEVEQSRDTNEAGPSRIPPEGVVVHLKGEGHNFNKKKGKKKFDLNDYLRKELNRKTRENQLVLHKASLVCLLGRGIMVNSWLRGEELLGIGLSLLPTKFSSAPKFINLEYLSRFVAWFRIHFKVVTWDSETSPDEDKELVDNLKEEMLSRNFSNYDNLVYCFIIFLRAIRVDVRLLWSLQPLQLKPVTGELLQKPKDTADEGSDNEDGQEEPTNSKPQQGKKRKSVDKEESNKGRKIISTDSDSDFEEQKGRKSKKGKKQFKKKSPSATKTVSKKLTQDMWAEVYLTEEERWVSVDLTTSKILCDSEVEKKATQPVLYVLAFDNVGKVKDLTRKYASNWLTYTLKQRVDGDWWYETLAPYAGKTTTRDAEEDEFLDEHLLAQPIPKTLSECKSHPMYVHNRHFLQYEALYPPDAVPVGFIRSEPVYSRDNVKTLRKRELWMRDAKVVKIGEVPYKIIKRPKWDRANRQILKDQPLELFGEWQTEDYVPPEAKDGKVPRNEYGNVELFKEKMLPKGCVHLRLPQLNRVAKKLNIDCAQALTDFEYSRAGCHPVYDGYVVCEEFEDILFDAWREDQEQQKKRDEEKRLARIHGNWKKLYRAVLIHQRIKMKYPDAFTQKSSPTKRKLDEQQPSSSGAKTKKRKN